MYQQRQIAQSKSRKELLLSTLQDWKWLPQATFVDLRTKFTVYARAWHAATVQITETHTEIDHDVYYTRTQGHLRSWDGRCT